MKRSVVCKFPIVMAVMIFMLLSAGINAPADTGGLVIPKNTIFRVKLLDDLNSNMNHKGDLVRMEVMEDVSVNGIVVIPRGTRGTGTVDDVKKAGMGGRQGQIKVTTGSFKAINGVDVPVKIGKGAAGKSTETDNILRAVVPSVSSTSSSSSSSSSFSWDPSGQSGSGHSSSSGTSFSFGLNPGWLIPGRDAYIDAGTELYVNTKDDIDLGLTFKQAAPPGSEQAQAGAGAQFTGSGAGAGAPAASSEQKPALVLHDVLVCRAISDDGDPVGVNKVFTSEVKSLAVWCSYDNAGTDTLLETMWYHEGELVRNKGLYIDADKKQNKVTGVIYSSEPFSKGNWKMDILLNGAVLKSIEFKIE